MLIEIHTSIPRVAVYRVQGKKNTGDVMTNVEIVGVCLGGLLVTGALNDEVYFSVITTQVFYTWVCQNFKPNELKFIPEPFRLNAEYSEWTKERPEGV